MRTLRLILDAAADGPANMAVDELLQANLMPAAALPGQPGQPALQLPPALRFYQWDRPTISLGYFQPADACDEQPGLLRRCELIRRPTGGGAILHDAELTYSLAIPSGWPPADHPTQLYPLVHRAIAAVLNELGVAARLYDGPSLGNAQRGPFFCFARRHPYDLVVNGDKIVGSAQRRRPGAILQHGSIMLRRSEPQPCVGVNDLAATAISAGDLADRLAARIADALGADLAPSRLTEAELALAEDLAPKYRSDSWTRQR
jgi:lipoate-protein ligase A